MMEECTLFFLNDEPGPVLVPNEPIFSNTNLARLKERMNHYYMLRGKNTLFKARDVKRFVRSFPQTHDLSTTLPKDVFALEAFLLPGDIKEAQSNYDTKVAAEAANEALKRSKGT
jgi:hypothetical protein